MIFKKIKALLAARKLYKAIKISEAALMEAQALEPIDRQPVPQTWKPDKTYGKAASSATTTVSSVAITAGPIVAALALVRILYPDKLPWSQSEDAIVAGALTAIASPLVAFILKWRADKKAHNGNTVDANK